MVTLSPGTLTLVVLAIFNLMVVPPTIHACDGQAETVVSTYLTGLASGDVAAIEGLVDGNQARRASAHFRNPRRYGAFLRKQYKRAVMTIVSTAPVEDACHVAVEFTYPLGEIESITLVLTTVGGVWKITDEII